MTPKQIATLSSEYHDDHGCCYYCGGRHFTSPLRWWNHLRKQHTDTIRTVGVEQATGLAARHEAESL